MVKVQIVFSFKGVSSPKHSLTEQHSLPTLYWSRCKAAPHSPQLGRGHNEALCGCSALRSLWRPRDERECLQGPETRGGLNHSRLPVNSLQLFLYCLKKSDLVGIRFPCVFEVTCYSFTSLSPQSSFQVPIFCCLA